jgi:hypothetical protein
MLVAPILLQVTKIVRRVIVKMTIGSIEEIGNSECNKTR